MGFAASSGRSACRSRSSSAMSLVQTSRSNRRRFPCRSRPSRKLCSACSAWRCRIRRQPARRRPVGRRRPGLDALGADEAMVVPRVCRRLVPDLHSAAVLLHVYATSFSNELDVANAAAKQTYGQMSEIVFMVLMPLFFRAAGCEMDAAGRHGGVGAAVRAVRLWRCRRRDMWMLYVGICCTAFATTSSSSPARFTSITKRRSMSRAAAQGFIAFVTLGLGPVRRLDRFRPRRRTLRDAGRGHRTRLATASGWCRPRWRAS